MVEIIILIQDITCFLPHSNLHVCPNIMIKHWCALFLVAAYYANKRMCQTLLSQFSIVGQVGCFYIFAITYNVAPRIVYIKLCANDGMTGTILKTLGPTFQSEVCVFRESNGS